MMITANYKDITLHDKFAMEAMKMLMTDPYYLKDNHHEHLVLQAYNIAAKMMKRSQTESVKD